MRRSLKTTLYVCTLLSVSSMHAVCFAQIYNQNDVGNLQNPPSAQNWANSRQNWRNSPDNWNNSSQNWQNSSQNWQNSPRNWQNSADNFYNNNGIYDRNGNRRGYAVPTPNGGINYFGNDGSRRGYQPGH